MQSRWHRGVSSVWRERKRGEEGERRKKREKKKKNPHAYSAFSSSTDTPISHITQTVTASSCKNTPSWKWKLKVVSVQLTDTQTHSVHEGTFCLSGGAIDNSDRADMSCLSTHSRDMTGPRIALKPGSLVTSLPFHVQVAFSARGRPRSAPGCR